MFICLLIYGVSLCRSLSVSESTRQPWLSTPLPRTRQRISASSPSPIWHVMYSLVPSVLLSPCSCRRWITSSRHGYRHSAAASACAIGPWRDTLPGFRNQLVVAALLIPFKSDQPIIARKYWCPACALSSVYRPNNTMVPCLRSVFPPWCLALFYVDSI
jgi:hypothetical protein